MKALGSDVNMYSVIDLFAGAGGLSLGFTQTRKFDIKVAFENSRDMQTTYKRNHPNVDVRGDVCKADYSKIQEKYGKIDIVIGGPPCQGFSNANRQRNTTISRNNSLVKEYIRAIKELNPIAFVMENVSMLSSDVHRFYLSISDQALVDNGIIETKNTRIPLLEKKYYFDGVVDIVKSIELINHYLWTEQDYTELNIIYKASNNKKKLINALEKHRKKLLIQANAHITCGNSSPIQLADSNAYISIKEYFDGTLHANQIKKKIEAGIMYQRMLRHAKEILENQIIVDRYSTDNGLFLELRSFAVLDYIIAMLGSGKEGYSINYDVLCAADFGAPQKRMRFLMVGIKKSITNCVSLPKGQIKADKYRTVHDAIADLEDVEPFYDVKDDTGVSTNESINNSDLFNILHDSELVMNHIVTNTTEIAMQRFKALNQGENFHSLDKKMKMNTYSDASRTQNTIYLRLDYSQPSGTVVNVRKSMWIHPKKDRAISIREAARLQTFPDSFVFTGTKDRQYQQVGNAVPPILAKAIAKELFKQLNGVSK